MRVRLSILTFGSAGFYSVATMLLGLVLTPYVLRWLGEERFGAFRALLEWGGYLALLELGLGGALFAILPRALAAGPAEVVGAGRAAGKAYRLVALMTLVAGCGLAVAAPWLIPVGPELRGELRWATVLLAVGGVLVVATPLRTLLEAAQLGYLVNLWLIVQGLLITGGAALLAWAGWGLVGQSAATVLGGLVFAIGVTGAAVRRWPGLLRRGAPDKSEESRSASAPPAVDWWAELWRTNRTTLLMNLCGRVSTLSDNLIVGLLLGPAVVTPFFLTQRLIQVASAQIGGIGSATWAALAAIHHGGDAALLRKRLVELSRLVVLVGGAAMVPIVAYNASFVRLWVGADGYAGERVTVLASALAVAAGLFSLWGWAFRGAGIIEPLLPLSLASAAVNVTVSLAATGLLGWIEGPLVGTAAAFLLVNAWWYPIFMKRYFDLTVRSLLSGLAGPVVATLGLAAAAWLIARRWPPSGWTQLACMMAGTAAVYAAVGWFALLSDEERREWRGRASGILNGRSQGRSP